MRGVQTLRIALGAVEKSMQPLHALGYVLSRRPPRDLDDVERVLVEHLADVEEALAHVRRMKIAIERPDPLEGVFSA